MLALGACSILAMASAAQAEGGCGRDFHRGPHGGCRANRGPMVVAPVVSPGVVGAVVAPGLTIGVFYPGRGYWDGHRYWHNRYRRHGVWRYR